MDTVLITGRDGFTGRYVQSEMEANGYRVIGLDSDLTDYDKLSAEIKKVNPDIVIHLAGIAFVAQDNARVFYDVNLVGTRNLLVALADQTDNIKSILLASSANIYGNRSEGKLAEDTLPDPVNDYAVSKLAMEYMAKLWNDKLPLFIVRPFNYTGVGQEEKFLIPKIIKHFKEKKSVIELGNIDVWREFGDVRTVADIYRQLVEQRPAGEAINICTGQAHSLKEVIELCEKITGHNIEIKINPQFVRTNEVRELTGDNTRLINIIGDIQYRELEETLGWMLSN